MKPYERLKEICDDSGFKQREIAESVGITPSALSMILSGKNPLTKTLAYAFELKFEVSAVWLLEGKKPKSSPSPKKLDPVESFLLDTFNSLPEDGQFLIATEMFFKKIRGERLYAIPTVYVDSDGDISPISKTIDELKQKIRDLESQAQFFIYDIIDEEGEVVEESLFFHYVLEYLNEDQGKSISESKWTKDRSDPDTIKLVKRRIDRFGQMLKELTTFSKRLYALEGKARFGIAMDNSSDGE